MLHLAEKNSTEPPRGGASPLHYFLLFVILAGAASIRFWDIQHAGIFSMDEARYLLDSYGKEIELRGIVGLFHAKWIEVSGGPAFELAPYVKTLHARLSEASVFFPKMLFYYLVGAVMLVTGFTTWAGAFVESVFGVLGVAATYLFARQIAGRRAALLAAALLAFSCFHIYNSRTTYPQTMPVFFATLAFACHARWALVPTRPRCLFAAGFLLGVSFWGGYQAASLVVPSAIAHAILCVYMKPHTLALKRFLGGGLLYALGFALALCLAEGVSYPVILLFRSQGLTYPHPTFFEVNWPRWTYHTALPSHVTGLAVFPYYLGLYEGYFGLVALLFLLATGVATATQFGLVAAGALRKGAAVRLIAFALIPGLMVYVTYAIKGVLVSRPYLFCLPFLATLVAALLAGLWRMPLPFRAWGRVVLCLGVGLVVVSSSRGISEVLQTRSGYPDVAAYFEQSGARLAPGPDSLILECYLKASDAAPPPPAAQEWAVYDLSELCVGLYPDEVPPSSHASRPRKEFRQPIGRILLETEGLEPYKDPFMALGRVRRLDLPRAARILVYDVQESESVSGAPPPVVP